MKKVLCSTLSILFAAPFAQAFTNTDLARICVEAGLSGSSCERASTEIIRNAVHAAVTDHSLINGRIWYEAKGNQFGIIYLSAHRTTCFFYLQGTETLQGACNP